MEVAMMQLREQIRKLLDRGYSLPFTGRAAPHVHQPDLAASRAFCHCLCAAWCILW